MVKNEEEAVGESFTKKKSKKKIVEFSQDTTNEISGDIQYKTKKSKKKCKTDVAQENDISFDQSETINLVSKKKKKFSDKNVALTHPEGNEEGAKKKDKLEEDVLCKLQKKKKKKKHISEEDFGSDDCVTKIDVAKKKKKKKTTGNDLGSQDLTAETADNMAKKKKTKKERTLEEESVLDICKCEDEAPKKKTLKIGNGSSGLLTDVKDDTAAKRKEMSEKTRIPDVNIGNKKKKKKTATFSQISDGDHLATKAEESAELLPLENIEAQDVCLTKEKKRKKEKKKMASYSYISNASTDNANGVDNFSDQLKKKKERKKANDHCQENDDVEEDDNGSTGGVVLKGKQKKSRKPNDQRKEVNDNETKESDVSVPHKRKKKKGMLQPEENAEMSHGTNGMADVVAQAVKKKKRQASEVTVDAGASDTVAKVSETSVAKKKKKASPLVAENQYNDSSHLSEVSKINKKGVYKPTEVDHRFAGTLSGMNNDVNTSLVTRKKKKRKLSIQQDTEGCGNVSEHEKEQHSDSSQVQNEGVKVKKSKHKKRKEKAMLTKGTDNCQDMDSDGEDKKKKSKKKREALLPEEQNTNKDTVDVLKKKKKRKEETDILVPQSSSTAAIDEEHDTEVQVVSVKPGNTDEIRIDTERRRILQEHIDRESGQKKGTTFGQWDTASFQSSEQQTKFFRLLGGFKKESQSAPPRPSHQEKFNMALGKTGEKALERSLLDEFDKALSWKQNRGIGLGFQPEQKKTFYIDKTASRSVKFED